MDNEKLLEKLLEVLEKSEGLIISEAPEILQEFYSWCFTRHMITLSVILVVLIGSFYATARLIKEHRLKTVKREYKYDGEYITISIFTGTVSLTMLIVLIVELTCFLKLHTAPKVYLIEHLLSLTN